MTELHISERHGLSGGVDHRMVLAVRVEQNPGKEGLHRLRKPAAQHHMGTHARYLPVQFIWFYAADFYVRTKLLEDTCYRLTVGT
jgi:hypothetical protein